MPKAVFHSKMSDELLQEVVGVIKASLQREKEKEKEREWREGFEAMGRDPDTNDVEYMLPAVREALLGR